MSASFEKDPDGTYGGFLTLNYPKIPKDTDFETFRKTDEDWKKIVAWYNKERIRKASIEGSASRKERFVFLQWPRDPNGPVMKKTPRGKHTSNGKHTQSLGICVGYGPSNFASRFRTLGCNSL